MLKVDCHFHPNFRFDFLGENSHKTKAEKIWRKFHGSGLDAVIITEHAFKKPALSYKIMLENKPNNSKIRVIPGIECVSKEGIDFLVRADDIYIYQIEELMNPKLLTIRELIDLVKKDPKLYCSIAHPYVPSDTAIMFHYDEKTLSKIIDKARVVEKHNYALHSTKMVFEKILPKKIIERLMKIEQLPDIFTYGYAYTGGSDAHTINSIGPYLEIDYTQVDTINSAIVNPTIGRKMMPNINLNTLQQLTESVKSGLIVIYESIKKRWHLYQIDTTYLDDKQINGE